MENVTPTANLGCAKFVLFSSTDGHLLPSYTTVNNGVSLWKIVLNDDFQGDYRNKKYRGERIRTSDILLPKQARYRTAPHPEFWQT